MRGARAQGSGAGSPGDTTTLRPSSDGPGGIEGTEGIYRPGVPAMAFPGAGTPTRGGAARTAGRLSGTMRPGRPARPAFVASPGPVPPRRIHEATATAVA